MNYVYRMLKLAPVQRHAVSTRQLPSKICPFDAKCCSYDIFIAEKVSVTFRTIHSAIYIFT